MNIPITLIPDSSGGFTVFSNVLSFVTEGNTLEEALKNAKEAATCHIEGLKKEEDEINDEYFQSLEKSMNTFLSI